MLRKVRPLTCKGSLKWVASERKFQKWKATTQKRYSISVDMIAMLDHGIDDW